MFEYQKQMLVKIMTQTAGDSTRDAWGPSKRLFMTQRTNAN